MRGIKNLFVAVRSVSADAVDYGVAGEGHWESAIVGTEDDDVVVLYSF